MRINRSARTRYFTVLGNEVLRDRRLSFTARGLLAYLVSLPDGAREDVRTLADKNPGVGRRGVAKALDELVEYGYYVRRTVRDEGSGQVRTETHVYDTPQADGGAPLPAPAGTGEAEAGKAGASPKESKNPEQEPTHPAPGPTGAEPSGGRAEGTAPTETTLAPMSEATERGSALLSRLGSVEPKLALSSADALALAPLAARWLEAGVSELEARSLLADGLPPVVHSARALVADRLVRKLPAPRSWRDAAAPAAPLVECAECRDPLPRGQQTGICAVCAGAALPVTEAVPVTETVSDRVAALRTVLRARPVTATARGLR
ncbi:helix-turn-helix domain-containing protein [Streptomyces sp. NPDC001339]|uniref:helix-turn-helix domain-containing protein n=1 Tax=Streptomyces sp. NPDC001339 TaxID=3364563 RepID=UPI00367A149C